MVKSFELVKKKVNEVNHRLKPLQDQIKKWKAELEKAQTAYKTKVRGIGLRARSDASFTSLDASVVLVQGIR